MNNNAFILTKYFTTLKYLEKSINVKIVWTQNTSQCFFVLHNLDILNKLVREWKEKNI